MTDTYAIFFRETGFLAFMCEAETPLDALKRFDAEVGINPHGADLIDIAVDLSYFVVTPEERDAIEAWDDTGSPADEYPLARAASFF